MLVILYERYLSVVRFYYFFFFFMNTCVMNLRSLILTNVKEQRFDVSPSP
jgi:hypothetical protein